MGTDKTRPVLRLNPNHAVTRHMDDQWPKIVALMMYRDGVQETVISPQVLIDATAQGAQLNITVRMDDARGIVLRLVDDAEARRLAREEGGLPV